MLYIRNPQCRLGRWHTLSC